MNTMVYRFSPQGVYRHFAESLSSGAREAKVTLGNVVAGSAAICTLASGLIGAWYWLKSSQIGFDPYKGGYEPVVNDMRTMAWLTEILTVSSEAARLNKIAARWTAAATIFGALTTLLPLFTP